VKTHSQQFWAQIFSKKTATKIFFHRQVIATRNYLRHHSAAFLRYRALKNFSVKAHKKTGNKRTVEKFQATAGSLVYCKK